MTVTTTKRALREALLSARRAVPPAVRLERSRRIAERVVSLSAFEAARTVALYAGLGAEVDTAELARAALAAGKQLAFPRISASGHALSFAACSPDALVAGALGTREPPRSAALVPAAELDLVVVPGVGFDVHGHRLGRGRGYYDATLAAVPARALRIGLAFELQLVPEIPREAHDTPVDAVITEARVLFRLPGGPDSGRSSH